MLIDESVSQWIQGLRTGDEDSARRLWERYFDRLGRLARQKLPAHAKRSFDEEDVALSAFHSLCAGIERGRFPDLDSRTELWSLLIVITARKVRRRLRDAAARKRGGGHVRGEADLEHDGHGIQEVIGREPTPEFALEVAEELERLLELLEDESLQRISTLRMEGYSNTEIASRLGCSLRTVERRLGLIRRIWIARSDNGDESR